MNKKTTVKNTSILFGYLCLAFLGYSCVPYVNIFNTVPLGSKLNKEMLQVAAQIYPHDQGLFILYDNAKDSLDRDYHLLYYDLSLELRGACYLSGNGIKDFSENIITSYLAPAYKSIKEYRESKWPHKFILNMPWAGNGLRVEQNKVITNLEVTHNGDVNSIWAVIKFRQGQQSYYPNINELSKEVENTSGAEIMLELRNIHFDKGRIYTVNHSPELNLVVYDYFMFSPGQLDKLYEMIYEDLLSSE